jgi:hypothetical protein
MSHETRFGFHLALMILILATIGGAAISSAAGNPPAETQVVFFTPAIPPGKPQEGSCWTRSIAVDRPGVWRCTVGNAIHDPCFQVPPNPDQLVCDADPALGKSGFVTKLTKALPPETAPPAVWPSPWIMKLADGSVCEPYTGTRPAVNGEPAPWFCIKPGVPPSPRTNSLVTKVNPGEVWTVDRYAESAASMGPPNSERRRVEAQVVPVLKVWQ